MDIATLVSDPSNARKHSNQNIDAIKGSLAKFGQQKPIVVGEKNIVIAGNGTLEAAKSLGWDTIDIYRTPLKGAEAMAFALADNKTAELAEWDDENLTAQLSALFDDGWDMEDLGFDVSDLGQGGNEGLTDPDDVPEVEENIHKVERGQIWQLGDHRVMCGDSTDKGDVDKLMGGGKPNIMLTDPPYGVSLDQSWRDKALGDKAMGKGNSRTIRNDDRADWLETYMNFTGNVSYVWHATSFTDVVKGNLQDAGFDVRQMIIWNKSIMVMGRSSYHWKHEPCWYAVRRGKDASWIGDRKQTTVWDAASPNHIMSGSKDDKTDHPSQKPLSICEIAIANHSGDVYDPFLGSGSTLIACEKTGRKCYGMEIDPHYCSVIIQRWQDFTGKEAKLA